MKKIVSVFSALLIILSLAFPAFAAGTDFIVDELDILYSDEIDVLNDIATDIYEETDVGIFFVFTEEDSLQDYDVDGLVGSIDSYFVMLENDESWYTFAAGGGKSIDEDDVRDAYDKADTYAGGIRDYLETAASFLDVVESEPEETFDDQILVMDEAELLSSSELTELNKKLQEISKEYKAYIYVVTLETMDGGNIDEFVEYLYDDMALGYGKNRDGVLLLVSMDPREYRILSNGYAGDAIGSSEISAISSAIKSDLSDGNYADAFTLFAEKCEYYLDGHLNGFPFDFGGSLLLALGIGILVGVITAFVLKGQLKSVRKQNQANVYVKSGSMQITTSNDFFLYRDVTRTKKESSSSSSGSGSRNVGGGSF